MPPKNLRTANRPKPTSAIDERQTTPEQIPGGSDIASTSNMSRILDKNNPLNWTVAELREKLNELGIAVPKGLSASVLRQLYNENKRSHVTDRPREIPQQADLGGNDVNVNKDGGQQALFTSLQMMAQSCTALQNTVTALLQKDKEKEEDNPLEKFKMIMQDRKSVV